MSKRIFALEYNRSFVGNPSDLWKILFFVVLECDCDETFVLGKGKRWYVLVFLLLISYSICNNPLFFIILSYNPISHLKCLNCLWNLCLNPSWNKLLYVIKSKLSSVIKHCSCNTLFLKHFQINWWSQSVFQWSLDIADFNCCLHHFKQFKEVIN